MTVERKISLFGLDRISVSRPVSSNSYEELVGYSLLSSFRRDVIVRSPDHLRVIDSYGNGDLLDRVISKNKINDAKIDNAQEGLFGKIVRISYVWKPSQNSETLFSEAEIVQ